MQNAKVFMKMLVRKLNSLKVFDKISKWIANDDDAMKMLWATFKCWN